MKKFACAFFMAILVFLSCHFSKIDLFFTYFASFDSEFCYVVDENVSNNGKNSVKCGAYNFVYFEKGKSVSNAKYKQVKLSDKTLLSKIIDDLDIQILFEENENYHIYYGFSQKFEDFRVYKDKKINFQIVVCDFLIIGYPMIYTGF